MLACFNTCVGLIACVGEYFHTLLSRIPYPALAAFFAAASMLIANLGLADILRLSVPVLNALYPVAIVLITLSFVPGLEQRRRVYPLCIGCTAVQSIAAALPLGPLSALANALPLAALGFGWVLPAVILKKSGLYEAEEGCLSLEGVRKTKRYQSIKVQYQTMDGKPRIKTFTGWTAQIIQHEIDHCDGILI